MLQDLSRFNVVCFKYCKRSCGTYRECLDWCEGCKDDDFVRGAVRRAGVLGTAEGASGTAVRSINTIPCYVLVCDCGDALFCVVRILWYCTF
jgi:hypothetical protein